MSLTWIREQARLRLTPTDQDFNEIYVGYDFAIRPEIIGYLAEQIMTGQVTGLNDPGIKTRLSLDEHELAIG